MASTAAAEPATNKCMPKQPKKNQGESNRKTPRTNVGVPEPWHAVLRKLAAKRKQPVLYLIISLAIDEAQKEGITDIPPAPWEEGEAEES